MKTFDELNAWIIRVHVGSQQNPGSKSQLKLGDRFTVWYGDLVSAFSKINTGDRFKAIVLKCADLEVFKKESDPDTVIRWQGTEVAILNPYKKGWTIVAMEQPLPIKI